MIICFLGIDGSGKSTLAKYLCHELTNAGYRATYVWWLEGERSLLRRTLKRLGTSKYIRLKMDPEGHPVSTTRGRMIDRIFKSLYPTAVILDYLRFALVNAWIPKIYAKDKTLVFDRFVYDVILGLSEEFEFNEAKQLKFFKLCSLLVPKPDIIFIIDVPPEIAFLRKRGEIESIQVAEEKREAYRRLNTVLNRLTSGTIVRIDNTQDVEHVKAEILKATVDIVKGGRS